MALKNIAKLALKRSPENCPNIDDRDQLDIADKVLISWPDHCPKPKIGLVQDRSPYPYWTKYERFMKNNQIPFEYYDVHQSNWLDVSKDLELILWVPEGATPYIMEEIRRKTYILEKLCGKVCFPSFDTLMWNEDKITQYELLRMRNFPVVETFISHNLSEALNWIPQLEYPLVFKSTIGAGSMTVELVVNERQAAHIVKTVFSPVGRMTYWPYMRQKDYVYFQKYQPNDGYDLRVIVIGNKVMGYYRDVPKGEFRASGMHTERYGTIHEDAMRLAMEVAKTLDEVIIAVDMLRDPRDGKFYITEMSAMMCIDVLGELKVNGVEGIYFFNSLGECSFHPGKFWTHELALREFLESKWISRFNAK